MEIPSKITTVRWSDWGNYHKGFQMIQPRNQVSRSNGIPWWLQTGLIKKSVLICQWGFTRRFLGGSMPSRILKSLRTKSMFIPLEDLIKDNAQLEQGLWKKSKIKTMVTNPDGHIYQPKKLPIRLIVGNQLFINKMDLNKHLKTWRCRNLWWWWLFTSLRDKDTQWQ